MGKAITLDGKGYTEKLPHPQYTGPLFYSIDDGEKSPMPAGGGVFLTPNDKKSHKLKILSERGNPWKTVPFDCSEYPTGTKIFYKPGGIYGSGWRTYPMPKDEKKCPWHPEHSKK